VPARRRPSAWTGTAGSDTLWGMCTPVTCKQCGRPSWKGCGLHVEQVLGHVAPEDRCACASDAPVAKRRWFGR